VKKYLQLLKRNRWEVVWVMPGSWYDRSRFLGCRGKRP